MITSTPMHEAVPGRRCGSSAGHYAEECRSDQGIRPGCLVIEGSVRLDEPGGDRDDH